MIAYFDTSAVVPLLVGESGSNVARRMWDEASTVVCVRLGYPEARSALAQARRDDRITDSQLRSAVLRLDQTYEQINVVEIDELLARRAGALAETLALRGYDAVHLAAALRVADDSVVLVAGDRALIRAARSMELTTAQID